MNSGEFFNTDILLNFGIKKATTHLHEGGSGIGLITVYEILRKYKASFILDELDNNTLFSKKLSISFNNLNQNFINSDRPEISLLTDQLNFIIQNTSK